jgi:glycosyltransferase involved in cell wall biosynthesis
MEKFVFHVVSLPHTQTTEEYVACAYTMKVNKFARMMTDLGHEVFVYSSEENEAPGTHVQLVSKAEQQAWFGQYDHREKFFELSWDNKHESWQVMNTRAIEKIKELRHSQRDFLCLIGGNCQKQIADGLTDMIPVEFGIGYSGVWSNYKVFESYAWMHNVYGMNGTDNGRFFDCVIPNYFDPADFEFSEKKDDYVLYIGRMISRKGVETAVEATRLSGDKLLLAGQGVLEHEPGKIVTSDFTVQGDHIEFIGHLDKQRRSDVMSKAKAVLLCTNYLEPFGGTSIEPMFCGTPVLTTDWGAFPENNVHGLTGYRFRTLGEAAWGLNHMSDLDPHAIRDYAVNNFGLDRCGVQYQAYFEQLYTLWEEGWYSKWDKGVSEYSRYTRFL